MVWNIACCLTAMRVALLRREAASTLMGPGLSMLLVRMTTPSLNRAATLQRCQVTLSQAVAEASFLSTVRGPDRDVAGPQAAWLHPGGP